MSTLIVESSNKADTPVQIEEKLLKAAESIQIQRENKQFVDNYLRTQQEKVDVVISKLFDNLVSEVSKVLVG